MEVMIGIDPHKESHTAVAIDTEEVIIDKLQVSASGPPLRFKWVREDTQERLRLQRDRLSILNGRLFGLVTSRTRHPTLRPHPNRGKGTILRVPTPGEISS